MTNEELVELIQSGKREYELELYNQNLPLIKKIATKFSYSVTAGRSAATSLFRLDRGRPALRSWQRLLVYHLCLPVDKAGAEAVHCTFWALNTYQRTCQVFVL